MSLEPPSISFAPVMPSAACGLVQRVAGGNNSLSPCSASSRNTRPTDSTITPRSSSVSVNSSNNVASLAETLVNTDNDDEEFDHAYHHYSQTSHMGVLDPSYKIFSSKKGYGAVLYKITNRTFVVSGDPMCAPEQYQCLLDEVRVFRKKQGLRIAFMGVSESFAHYALKQGWLSLQFGQERVLNPMTSEFLSNGKASKSSKRMIAQNRQLLDPKRGGNTIHTYAPAITGVEPAKEVELQKIYDDWRRERNNKKGSDVQTFVTVYDLFSRPDITFFIYTRDQEGHVTGFAALRSLGAAEGFQLDPCIAASSAPRGITDLLVITAMKLLRDAEISYLSLGYEPFLSLGDAPDQEGVMAKVAREGYRRVVDSAQLSGKKKYNDKFRPDDSLSTGLYIVLPGGVTLPQQAVAVMHVANIKIRRLFM